MKLPKFARRWLGRATWAITLLAMRFSRVGNIDGIEVCDLMATDLAKSNFFKPTAKAMQLIREFDPRRYQRVCRQLRYIVNRPLISGGTYHRSTKICSVDYNRIFAGENTEWKLRSYACLIVHEATHGLLMERGLAYNDKTWERSEKLCCLEEYRFIRRVDEWWADEYRSPKRFNSDWWKRHRESQEARKKAWRKRGLELRQERLKKKREEGREKKYEILRKKGRRLF